MPLFVCPKCEVLIDSLRYFSSNARCECDYEGSLYRQAEWPQNYIFSLMNVRDYYKDIFFSCREQKHIKDTRYYQKIVFDTNVKINDICERYGVDLNNIRNIKSK